ncbi:MAG: D-alanine--D-alanine ligase [Christensenellales bacterium]|jgi:D-alanine-D-alanine ligase
MKNIAVFYGGKSVEHEVSVITGLQVLENIDKELFNPIPIYIDKQGIWWKVEDALNKATYKNFASAKKQKVFMKAGSKSLFLKKRFTLQEIKIYAAINLCHGTNGEDGVLQGTLDCLGIANSGSDVLASALCMNKIILKQLFEFHKFPCTKWVWFERGTKINLDDIELAYPLIVKPANLGSSVGISKCENKQELENALKVAFEFDRFAVVEECVQNLQEINCSVQMLNGEVETSELETPISWDKFLSYEDKYVSKNKSQAKRIVSPRLSRKLMNTVELLSKQAYIKFGLSGVIRIDYLYNTQTKEFYMNEINTIPGSLSFYLWKPKGISFKKQISLQIQQAEEKQAQKNKNNTNFNSVLLN